MRWVVAGVLLWLLPVAGVLLYLFVDWTRCPRRSKWRGRCELRRWHLCQHRVGGHTWPR